MKTTIKRHRRRITKHRKGMTKPRKSNRRIKNRKHKTRRQSGGWGWWKSFIKADDNPLKIVFENNPVLLARMVTGKNKGIDVKYKTESSGNRVWLIGNKDKTFKELRDGAKDERYRTFINVLLKKHPYFNRFETQKDRDSSKGIILTDELFCEMFINKPVHDDLNYPRLIEKFNSSGFTCLGSAAPMSAAPMSAAPMSVVRAPIRAPIRAPMSAAPISAPTQLPFTSLSISTAVPPRLYQQPLQQQPVTTKYFEKLQQIKNMNLPNVTDQLIAQVLNNAEGNIKDAVAILSFPIQERATIKDFLDAQNGTLPQILGGGKCPTYDQALQEIKAGRKANHWIWYIIPSSPGYRVRSNFFGIGPKATNPIVTPEQYLRHPILGERYVEILNEIGAKLQEFMTKPHNHDEVKQFLIKLMGKLVDYDKLMDSLTIFSNDLKTQGKVTPEIAVLAIHLRVQLYAPPLGPPPGTSAAFRAPSSGPSAEEPYVTTKYLNELNQIQKMRMGFDDQAIAQALNNAHGIVNSALNELIDAQNTPPARGGPSAAPMSAAGTSAAGTSAAGTSAAPLRTAAPVSTEVVFGAPEPAFPVRHLLFTPTIADLMFPDNFVIKYANKYGIQFEQQESYHPDTHGRTLINFTACPDVANWTVMYTIGDMNCLTHAFLQCKSSMYRKIHVTHPEIQAEKTGVARAFRLAFAYIDPDILDKTEAKLDLLNKGGMEDLGEGTFASYARLFGVILVVFDVRNGQVMVANLTHETAIKTMQVIFMHGDGGHYSSVLPPIHSGSNPSGSNPFVITYEHAKQIGCLTVPLTFPNEAALND